MLKIKVQTALALGVNNLAKVAWYRAGVKTGLNPVRRLKASITPGAFFLMPERRVPAELPVNRAWVDQQCYFGWLIHQDAGVPDWHRNCFTSATVPDAGQPWWMIADFDPSVGDIKTVWEASRFDWVLVFMQQALHGDVAALQKLNDWLADWLQHNPCYTGPNWKCGQEAAIRVMHLAMALLLARQEKSVSLPLQQLIAAHLQRIAPTLLYALAQDNNHGTSEAAALFIGGALLEQCGHPQGQQWRRQGLKHLENRALHLIGEDGVFSQYSVTYHRVMLDTYSMAELWRARLELPLFSAGLYARLVQATLWLQQMIVGECGDAPNWGANDGARLLPLTDTDYRDFRPSVAMAGALFLKKSVLADNPGACAQLQWLELDTDLPLLAPPHSASCDSGGLIMLRQPDVFAMLRFPAFRFRPSQCDALHLDVWVRGRNLIRDGGSYTYNTTPELVNYFSGVASHSTVEFDNRNQMPKLSRFLFGAWLRSRDVASEFYPDGGGSAEASYTDWQGATHRRQVLLNDFLTVADTLSGFETKAVLRWRLSPGDWVISGNECRLRDGSIRLRVSPNVAEIKLSQGLESRYYLQKTALPVLEITLLTPGTVITEFEF